MKPQILVTAFEPFLDHPQNSSEMLLPFLEQRSDVETLLLPVTFQEAFQSLFQHWQSQGPYKGLVMLGQAAGRKAVCLERVALNWMESSLPDNKGVAPAGQRILADAPDSYIVDFFPSHWRDQLNNLGPTAISFTAGAYVCNNIYFRMTHELRKQKIPALFVHVPLRPEQLKPDDETPTLAGPLQEKIISGILDLMQSS